MRGLNRDKEQERDGEMTRGGWDCKGEAVSFSAMAAVEFISVGLSTLYKAAAAKGLSYFVLIVYTNAIGALTLLPLIFVFPRTELASIFNTSILYRFVLLALFGFTASVCALKGIEYTSPTICSAISNLTPAFTFVFAVAFRLESLDFRSWKTVAKTAGTAVSISGALITILYKGPEIITSSSSSQPSSLSLENPLRASLTNWVMGGILLVTGCVFASLCFILQTQIVKLYPSELTVAVLSSLLTSIVAAAFGAIVENNKNAWMLKTDLALATVLITGIFGPALATAIHTWGLNMKGPVYVTIFKPFSIAIAAAMGVMFLGDALYLGSVIGATIILVGFYAVIWGKTKEEANITCASDDCLLGVGSSSDKKTPLLL